MLYDRDYKILTKKEQQEWEKLKKTYKIYLEDPFSEHSLVSGKAISDFYHSAPPAINFHTSLFPNNYLNTSELHETEKVSSLIQDFRSLLETAKTENEIQSFIKTKKAYFIIGSIFQLFNFGHHQAFAFSEFPLPPNYIADYLLVGKNSGGYEFIFIELESPTGSITTKKGDFGTAIRKGIKQIEDWDTWLDGYYSNLKPFFESNLSPLKSLPKEFHTLDKSRIHYVLIAGKRTDFKETTYRTARKYYKNQNIRVIHYDNLIDTTALLLQSKNY